MPISNGNDDLDAVCEQAQLVICEEKQQRMRDLLDKNRECTLTEHESNELDRLMAEFDAATLAKGTALATIAHSNRGPRQG